MRLNHLKNSHYLPSRGQEGQRSDFWVESFEEAEHILGIMCFPCKISRIRVEPFSKFLHAHFEYLPDDYRLYEYPEPRHQRWLHKPR
jgi:hypothetical protein